MGYDTLILFINTATIIVLLALTLLLCAATRFKGVGSYMALIILSITFINYIYDYSHHMGWSDIVLLSAPLAYSANLTLMPFLLLMAQRGFNPHYKFRYSSLLHFLPAIAFAVLVAMNIYAMPPEEIHHFTIERSAIFQSTLTTVNFLTLCVQLVIYFFLIFRYLRRKKQYIFKNLSQAELTEKIWIPRFISIMGVLIVTAMIGSLFNPVSGFRLFYVINMVAMGCLLYQELKHALSYRQSLIENPPIHYRQVQSLLAEDEPEIIEPKNSSAKPSDDDTELLEQYAREVEKYLTDSMAYVNPALSLAEVAKATGISSRNISRAINTILDRNFFNLVNSLRVEKSKSLLQAKKQKGLTLETIAEQCGFNSQYTFCRAFKRSTGLSTSEWLRLSK